MKITTPLPDTEQSLFYSAINALRIAGQEELADDFDQRMENLIESKSIMTKEQLQCIVENMIAEDESVILADGFENAFVGIGRQFTTPFAIYDRKKCIETLMKDMSEEEAEEFFEYNTQGAYVGNATPVFLDMLEFNDEIKTQLERL